MPTARAVASKPIAIGIPGEGGLPLAVIGSGGGAVDSNGAASVSGARPPPVSPGAGAASDVAGGKIGTAPGGTPAAPSSIPPSFDSGSGSAGAGVPEPMPGAGGAVLDGATVVTFFSRGGGE